MANKKVVIDITAKDKTKKGIKQSESSLKAFAKTAGPLISAAFGAAALTRVSSDFVAINKEFERLNASLVTVTGSTKAANAAFKNIEDFATRTPFQLNQVVDSFIKLKAMGLDPSNAALMSYGNTASAMGKDLNQMIEAVADAATGEFERLKEFGIKARSEGDNVSFTFRGVTTTVKKEAAAIEGFLRDIGNVEFAGGMERQMATLGGAISNLQDSYEKMFRGMGQDSGLADTLAEAIRGLSSVLASDELINALSTVGSGLSVIAIGAKDAAVFVKDLTSELDNMPDLASLIPVLRELGAIGLIADLINQPPALGGVTFPAPPRPTPAGVSGATGGGGGGAADSSADFTGFGGASVWESEALKEIALGRLQEFHEEKFALEIEAGEQMTDLWMTQSESRAEAETRGIEIIMDRERELTAFKKIQQVSAANNAIALIGILGRKHKGAAIVALALQKGLMISTTITATLAAQMQAMAQLGPIAGPPAAASIGAWGAVNVGLIAATGIAEAAFSGGGGGGGAGGGGGSISSPVVTQPVATEEASTSRQINITVMGNIVDQDKFARELVPSITRAIQDGAR